MDESDKACKYCDIPVLDLSNEALKCESCAQSVHLTCLKRGSTPGALAGDVFFTFTCFECSNGEGEIFVRENMKWFQVMVLVFYHLHAHNKGLSRRGFYHWRMHVATFIDKNWSVLFGKTAKQRKNWMGTISGFLSVHGNTFFTRCRMFTEQGWWTITFPKLTPNVHFKLLTELNAMKQTMKAQNITREDAGLLLDIVHSKKFPDEYITMTISLAALETVKTDEDKCNEENDSNVMELETPSIIPLLSTNEQEESQSVYAKSRKQSTKKRTLLPNFDSFDLESSAIPPPKKKQKLNRHASSSSQTSISLSDGTSTSSSQNSADSLLMHKSSSLYIKNETMENGVKGINAECSVKLLDPMCHYNTSLNNLYMLRRLNLVSKLMGGLREEPILSPYSNLYLKPYIRRDCKIIPQWLKIMAQIQLKVNENVKDYVLPTRSAIDYVYVQPSHIPAINSLCNQFFWPGIDLSDCLQYPDFSCVVMYRNLIVGFAFIVPDVDVHENYISFIFVRPGWRNVGIAKFMLYHLIQTSMGKDITLHVAVNNPALMLYQKFGFKVEHVVQNFYDKYLRNDSFESKHAFFCRLER